MSNIDERVVSMKFDNAQFEHGIKTTLASLDALNKSLKLEGATKGLSDLNNAGKNVQLGHISDSLDNIGNHFHAMSVVAITALATIAHKAVEVGSSLVKSLTIDPLKSGFAEYETNLNSIQTILANTGAASVSLEQVTAALDELNHYADLTIYSFSEMARNIGTFTAAGVALTPAVSAIKGIANLAALSGSNSMQAATAMYQLSQALSTGTVKLIDWNSVVNAGMGGTVFQRALAETAVVMGKLNSGAVTLSGSMKTVKIDGDSFRSSLEKGWLTADVLTNTLAQFTGDLKDAELAALGFSQTQITAIQKQAATAKAAATEVKTMSQLLGALRESAGSGWAQTWQLIFGNFTEAKQLWTGVYSVLDGIIGGSADARNQLLKDWKEAGGRADLLEGIGNVFKAFAAFVEPIREAFRTIFPPATGQRLAEISKNFREFTEQLMPSKETLEQISRIASGLFSVLDVGWTIISKGIGLIAHLLGLAFEGSGGFLEFAASIGDFLTNLRIAIYEGGSINETFENLGRILEVPIDMLRILGQAIAKVFGGVDTEAAAEGVADFIGGVNILGGLADFIVNAWSKVISLFDELWNAMEPFANKIAEWSHEISMAVGGLNFESLLNAINTGVFAGFLVMFHNLLGRKSGITGVISELTSTLSAMQHTLQAATLLQIAIAIGVLAAAALVMSEIDSEKLGKALSALAIMFTQLLAALAIMSKLPDTNVVKLYITAAALTVLGIAINILALAVRQLAGIDAKALHKGLIATTLLIGAVVGAARLLPSGAELVGVGVSLLILSTAILVLTQSVKQLATLDWEELAKGLTGVAVLLAALTLFTKFAQANATGILAGAGIVLLAAGIKILASAVMDLSSVSWENIGKGMAVLATSLALIGGALMFIPPTAPLQAAGIAVVAASMLILAQAIESISAISWENVGKGMAVLSVSLLLITAALVVLSDAAPTALLSAGAVFVVALAVKILAEAIGEMSKMSWQEIAKGLIVLAGSLAIIVIALNAMTSAVPGALALFVVANSLLVLSGVLKILGSMSWGEIVKGLVTLAAVFLVLGVAGALLTPVIPTLLGLGAAIALIGLGLALAGAGLLLFATGLTALSVAGAAGAAAIVAILSGIIGLIPAIVQQIGVALLILLDVLIEAVPKIVELIVKLIIQLLDALDELLPKLGAFIVKLILVILTILEQAIPRLVEAGLHILLGILAGIRNNIGKVVDTVTEIIVEFLKAMGRNLPKIVDQGFKTIVALIQGISRAIDANADALGRAGADLAFALVQGVVKGLGSFGGRITEKLMSLARNAWNAVLDFFGVHSPSTEAIWMSRMIVEGLAIGLERYSKLSEEAAEHVGEKTLEGLSRSLADISTMVHDNVDLTPTITPVLDLTDVKRRSAELWNMLDTKPIAVDSALVSAQQAEAGVQQTRDDADSSDSLGGDTFNFVQNNTSPKALSTADIYRNTKNQLSTARGVLPT